MAITNYADSSFILVCSWKHFLIGWSFVKYSWHQQCLQVEHPTMVNNVKHVSTKGPFLKYSWHLRFFNWHTIKGLTSVQQFWFNTLSTHIYGWYNVLEDGWNAVLFTTLLQLFISTRLITISGQFQFYTYNILIFIQK
jgi:hypothetical protein